MRWVLPILSIDFLAPARPVPAGNLLEELNCSFYEPKNHFAGGPARAAGAARVKVTFSAGGPAL